jgi:hypothetical protein
MPLSWRDGAATIFVAAAAVTYIMWQTGTAVFGISNTRAVAGLIFAFGVAACYANQAEMAAVYGAKGHRMASMPYVVAASVIGAVALTAGVLAMVTSSEAMLATLIGAMVVLWTGSVVRHTMPAGERRPAGAGRPRTHHHA